MNFMNTIFRNLELHPLTFTNACRTFKEIKQWMESQSDDE